MKSYLGRIVFTLLMTVVLAGSALLGADFPPQWRTAQEAQGTLVGLAVTLSTDTVGATSDLTLTFSLLGDELPPGATIQMAFPPEFDKSEIDSASYQDTDEVNEDYQVLSWAAANDIVTVELDTLGTAPETGSQVSITVYGVGNAETVDSYRLALAVLDSLDVWLAVPAWTPGFDLQPGEVVEFSLDPSGIISIDAGDVVHFEVTSVDAYGNAVLPEPGAVLWELVQAPPGAQPVVDGRFEAKIAGSYRLQATYESFVEQCIIYVLPGELAQFRMSGGSTSARAGIPWEDSEDDVLISAYDVFGNLITDFEGEVYFTCTDPAADLPATSGAPFEFTLDDQGKHAFAGSGFIFYTAGLQDIDLWSNTNKQATLADINVLAGLPAEFQASAPNETIAGVPFAITIADAFDEYGNAVAGIARVSLFSGDGVSPSGSQPGLHDFIVSAGEGSGMATLVAAFGTEIKVELDSLSEVIEIGVSPAEIEEFTFDLAPLQVPGQAFRAPAQLTAFDRFGNLVSNFDAGQNPITITSSGAGVMINPVINTGSAFDDGVCDLTALGVGYSGSELTASFTATSSSEKSGKSPLVEFSRVLITAGGIDADSLFVGEDFTISLTITNYGTQPFTVEELTLQANGTEFTDFVLSPPLPQEIAGSSNQQFQLSGTTASLSQGEILWSASFTGTLGDAPISSALDGFASLTILGQEGVSLLPESFGPLQVSLGRSYNYSIAIKNGSVSDLKLMTGSSLALLSDGTEILSLNLKQQTVVSSGQSLELEFEPGTITGGSSLTVDEISLSLVGTLGGIEYRSELHGAVELTAQSLPQISYMQSSLEPNILYRGRAVDFQLDVNNAGDGELAETEVELFIYAEAQMLSASQLAGDDLNLPPGETELDFNSLFLPTDFPIDIDSVVLTIQGTCNDYQESFRLNLPAAELTIASGPAVAVTDVTNGAPNPPWVNLGQQFQLSATVLNQGDEDLRDIELQLSSNGSSSFEESLDISFLSLSAETTVVFDVDAALQSTSSESFTVSLISATGVSSDLDAELMPPTSHNEFVVIQRPANLSLSAMISSPQEAQDGIIKPGEEFVITALVENSGQADVDAGELTLSLTAGDFSSGDPLTQEFTVNHPVTWRITAPDLPDSGGFAIAISTTPTDLNVEVPARITSGNAELGMAVRESEVEISIDFQALTAPVISAGGSYNVLDLDFAVLGDEKPFLRYLDLWLIDRNDQVIPPAEIVASSRLELNDEYEIDGVASGETGGLRFLLGAEYGTPESASISMTIADNPAHQDFTLHLDSTSFSAAFAGAAGERPVPVRAAFATRLLIEQSFTLVSGQLDEAFFCYPNPFSPERQALTFTNPMPEKSKTLAIYTLTGEEVFRSEIGVETGSEFAWDGRNEAGQMVLNGVYLAVLTIPGESELRIKVAVVK